MAKRLRMPKTLQELEAAEQQIRDLQREVDYTIREYPIEVLVSKFTEREEEGLNEIFVPDYQRDFVWDDKRQCKFIESLLIGLPIPYLFVADVGGDIETSGRLEIVDGTQRIRTLARFLADDLALSNLEKLTALNGFRFGDLPPSRQRRFNRITMRLIELTERANEETRRDMFDRINTGSVELNDMESRRGRYPGRFMEMIKSLAAEERFKELAPVTGAQDKRFEREELVARFFALREGYENFGLAGVGKVVNVFVDDFARRMTLQFEAEGANNDTEQNLRAVWNRMLDFVEEKFPYGFAKSTTARATPRVRFEAIAVGVSRALGEQDPPVGEDDIAEWLEGEEFRKLTTSDAANNRARVLNRINFVRSKLLAKPVVPLAESEAKEDGQ